MISETFSSVFILPLMLLMPKTALFCIFRHGFICTQKRPLFYSFQIPSFFELSDDEKNKIAVNPPSRDISSGTGIQLCAMSAQPSMMNNTPTHFTTSTVSWKNTMAATMPST